MTMRIGIIFGGRSPEHEVSIRSARCIIDSLDRNVLEPIPIAIDRSGRWFLSNERLSIPVSGRPIILTMDGQGIVHDAESYETIVKLEALFPVLHGAYGEDGSIQGLARWAGLPCVGAAMLGSSVAMDKDVTKRLLRDGGIASTPFAVFRDRHSAIAGYSDLAEKWNNHMIVKPANQGSSIGITQVLDREQYRQAIEHAFEYDDKILVERLITGREIEIAVLGGSRLETSVPGEIITPDGFYSYEEKYSAQQRTRIEAPANLPPDIIKRIQQIAVHCCHLLCIQGMARVDFFYANDGQLFVNEVNTIPGFTPYSLYPLLWRISGVPTEILINRLIQIAVEQHERHLCHNTFPE